MKKVFIDGSSGTTGLRIYERLAARPDISLIRLTEADRKDAACRKAALNESDIAFLCLPDTAAVEAVGMLENPDTVVLDTSTAHRTNPAFAYGFPELSPEFETKIRASHRIAVPGCHASGFIALVYPLIRAGVLSPDTALSCFSLTGYSGGGKKMIAEYESPEPDPLLSAPRQYGITQEHKHLKEMVAVTGLTTAPAFCPIVADFYSGMEVTVPLFGKDLGCDVNDLGAIYSDAYHSAIVSFRDAPDEGGFLSSAALSGKDSMEISVAGNADRILLYARYDNLGKGASGAALECMNLVLGLDPTTGLIL